MSTEVWVGEKVVNGTTLTFDWHFLSSEWSNTYLNNPKTVLPVLTIVSGSLVSNGQKIEFKFQNHFINFQPNKNEIMAFDIEPCRQTLNLRKSSFVFSISGHNTEIRGDIYRFKNAVILAIKKVANVTSALRISDIEVSLLSFILFN